MSISGFLTSLFILLFLLFPHSSFSQLQKKSIGIGTVLSFEHAQAILTTSINQNIEVGLGLGFTFESFDVHDEEYPDIQDPAAKTILSFSGTVKYFIKDNSDFSPYLGFKLSYFENPKSQIISGSGTGQSIYESSYQTYGVAGLFGAQYFLSEHFAFFTHIGIGFEHSTTVNNNIYNGVSKKRTKKTSSFKIDKTELGAIFYL
ncbi:hypothetical protein ACFLSQ_03135 [Bacteroidota bacterium]